MGMARVCNESGRVGFYVELCVIAAGSMASIAKY